MGQVLSGYAEGAIWGNAQQTLRTEGDSQMARENRLFLFLQLSIPALAWLDLSLPLEGRYELLPDVEWRGRPVSVIRNRSYQERKIRDRLLKLLRAAQCHCRLNFSQPLPSSLHYAVTSR